MKKNLVFLEFHDEAESFLLYCQRQEIPLAEVLIIALQPEVQVFCKKNRIDYTNTLPFFSNSEHEQCLLISEKWLKFLESELSIHDNNGIQETYKNTFLFYLRLYINHFLYLTKIVSAVSTSVTIERLYVIVSENIFHAHNSPLTQPDERFLQHIVKSTASLRDIPVQEIVNDILKPSSPPRTQPGFFGSLLNRMIGTFFYSWPCLSRKKKTTIFGSIGYNLHHVAKEIRTRSSVRLCYFTKISPGVAFLKFLMEKLPFLSSRNQKSVPVLPLSVQRYGPATEAEAASKKQLHSCLLTALACLNTLRDVFVHEGLHFIELFLDKIAADLVPYTESLFDQAVVIRKILQKIDPRLYIAPFARDLALLACEICNQQQIPTLMISHGTLKKPTNRYEEIEFRHMGESLILSREFRYVAIQTPAEEKILAYYGSRSIPLKTGPLILSKVDPDLKNRGAAGKHHAKILLVYPESTRRRDNTRFYVYETFDEFLYSMTCLVTAVDRLDNIHLHIRLHSGHAVSPEDLKLLLPESDHLSISSPERAFYETLSVTDVLINYSSTVIDDAIQNHVPVLLFETRDRYCHYPEAIRTYEPSKTICNPVFAMNSEDPNEIALFLEWIAENLPSRTFEKTLYAPYIMDLTGVEQIIDLIHLRAAKRHTKLKGA